MQQQQKKRYDAKVQTQVFQPGQKVLLLHLRSENKLLMNWQGPFDEQGPMNYIVKGG